MGAMLQNTPLKSSSTAMDLPVTDRMKSNQTVTGLNIQQVHNYL